MAKTFLLLQPWGVAGGADRCGLDLCEWFKGQGWSVVTCVTRENSRGNTWRAKFEALGEFVDFGPDWRVGRCSERVRDLMLRLRPAALCVNNSHEGFACARMMRDLVPECLMTCLIHMDLPGSWDFCGQLAKGQHQWFHRILTVSTRLVRHLKALGVPQDKLQAVPWFGFKADPAPDTLLTMREVVRRELNIRPDQYTILFPCRLEAQKQPRLIPQIAKALLPGNNQIFIVAGDGTAGPRVRQAVQENGHAGNFRFLGGVEPENMQALYAASDVLCLPSLDEGVPLVFFEAMQCGVPIVGSDVGACAELVGNGATGILIPKGAHQHADNYAEALRYLMKNPDKSKLLADQAKKRVDGPFSYHNWQARIAKAFGGAGLPAGSMLVPTKVPVNKVFIIGAPRTGTTSVGEALRLMGCRNYGFDPYMQELYNHGNYAPIWEVVGMYDSFSDGPFNSGLFYKVLAERYQSARFILTVRNKQDWRESHRNHFDPGVPNRHVPAQFKMQRYESDTWSRWYDERNAEIRAFFHRQNRAHHLLEFNISTEQNPWGRLVEFLQGEVTVPNPMPVFPRLNQFRSP
jgi:glycosyltransferase involved in cell wall biosynthesis